MDPAAQAPISRELGGRVSRKGILPVSQFPGFAPVTVRVTFPRAATNRPRLRGRPPTLYHSGIVTRKVAVRATEWGYSPIRGHTAPAGMTSQGGVGTGSLHSGTFRELTIKHHHPKPKLSWAPKVAGDYQVKC